MSPSAVMYYLRDEGLIDPKADEIIEGVSYFRLKQPLSMDSLKVVAVFGYDETSTFPFDRGPGGTSPGYVLGIIVEAPKAALDDWRSRHRSISLSYESPPLAEGFNADATEIECRFGPPTDDDE